MALLGSLQRPSEAVAAGPLVSSLGTILFPHGILLAIHHVLLDSQIESGIQGANNNNLQHHVARRNSNHAPAATAVPHGLAENSREHKKQLARGRCSVMVLLLEQVLRALRLSLLIVGERHDEPSSTSSSGAPSPEPGEDIGCDSTTTGDAPTSALTANLGHTGTSKTIGITGDTAIHAVASAGKSSRSVNANGHMGGIAIDHRGRVVSTSVTSHEDSATAMRLERYSDYDGDVDRKSGNLEVRSERGSGAAEGQRAVVGAWLLAKETCRCLSTIVTAARLPPSSSDSTTTAAAMDTSGVDEREGESISREEFGSWMLSEKDVMGIGEALLESLLALKHMGCVASAQVRQWRNGFVTCFPPCAEYGRGHNILGFESRCLSVKRVSTIDHVPWLSKVCFSSPLHCWHEMLKAGPATVGCVGYNVLTFERKLSNFPGMGRLFTCTCTHVKCKKEHEE